MQEWSLTGRRILVVDDEVLIALWIVELLEPLGAVVLGPCTTLAEAWALLGRQATGPDAAVLDVHLNGDTTMPLADILAEANVPIVFTTATPGDIAVRHNRHPVCVKPFVPGILEQALRTCLPMSAPPAV